MPHYGGNPHHVDLGVLLRAVRCERSLKIEGSVLESISLNLSTVSKLPAVEVCLYGLSRIDIFEISRAFPRLNSLSFEYCTFKQPGITATISHIQSLYMKANMQVSALRGLWFPSLTKVTFQQPKESTFHQHPDYRPVCDEFLAHHCTFKALQIDSSTSIEKCAEAAEQVTTLTLEYKQIGYLAYGGPLPALKTPSISRMNLFSLSSFDAFIKARCLPTSHPLSAALPSQVIIDRLCIEVSEQYFEESGLKHSELFIEARKQMSGFQGEIWFLRIELS